MQCYRILIVDEDPMTRRFLRVNLEARNYETYIALDGPEALQIVESEFPDLVILSVSLPRIDGLEICRRLRKQSQVPVIMLGTSNNEADRIKVLDLGADDYIVKPFGVQEFIARLKAVLRRSELMDIVPARASFSSGKLQVQFSERRVTVADREIKLTPTEYNLLQTLALNADKVLPHSYLLNQVWGNGHSQEREYLRVFVGRLRKKLEPDPKRPNYIVTVPWVGYKLSTVTRN